MFTRSFDPNASAPLSVSTAAKPAAIQPAVLPLTADTAAPVITLTAPQITPGADLVARETTLVVTGTVSDNSGVAMVTVNGQQALLDENGNFSSEVLLKIGRNSIVVAALDVHRNQATQEFSVRREGLKEAVARPRGDVYPPAIVLTAPRITRGVNLRVQDTNLQVTGRVHDDSGVAVVRINGQEAVLDENGHFSAEVLLKLGENSIVVSALDIHRNEETERFTVVREGAPAPRPAADLTPPAITITNPQTTRGVTLVARETSVKVTGTAKDDSGVAIVTVNGQPAALDEHGNFAAEVLLKVGENSIVVSAIDIFRNQATEQVTMTREGTPVAGREAAPALLSKGKDLALVIGINDYRHLDRLRTAVADAGRVAQVLQETYGFETKLLLDGQATRAGIIRELNALRRQLTSEDRLLIYYAGHGDYSRETDTAYWLPVDAERDETTYWIPSKTISDEMKRISARHVLVVADSCFSGTLSRTANTELFANDTREKFLLKQQEKPSRVLIASGGNEPVSDSGGDGHSIFASAFIRALENPGRDMFTAEELHTNHLKESVAGRADQTPEYKVIRNSGHDGGDFVFLKRK